MTHKDDKEAVIPLNKEMEEQLSIWINNINLRIDLAKEIEKKDKEIERLNNIINELENLIIATQDSELISRLKELQEK